MIFYLHSADSYRENAKSDLRDLLDQRWISVHDLARHNILSAQHLYLSSGDD